MQKTLSDAHSAALEKIKRNAGNIGPRFPHVAIVDGKYNEEDPSFWTGGFWGGLLWLCYRETGDSGALQAALDIEEKLDAPLREFVRLHHDVGFMWLPTAVAHYRLLGGEGARIRALTAASHLMGRFNLAGRFIRAWNEAVEPGCEGFAIIDCLMNLPLLYWAGKELDDPRFSQIARAHTDTVLKSFLRPDGTSAHIVHFDPVTGERIGALGGQGYGPDSVWARGQAWAIYGMAIAYRETGDGRYLAAAKKTAAYFLEHLPPDLIPYWDFSAPKQLRGARDSSAACCAASGLLEIASLLPAGNEKEGFTRGARLLLEALCKECACFDDTSQGIIGRGTVNYPARKHINVPIIYRDFFFVEALQKLDGKPGLF